MSIYSKKRVSEKELFPRGLPNENKRKPVVGIDSEQPLSVRSTKAEQKRNNIINDRIAKGDFLPGLGKLKTKASHFGDRPVPTERLKKRLYG